MKQPLIILLVVFLSGCGVFGGKSFEKYHRTPGAELDDDVANRTIIRNLKKQALLKNNNININTFNGIVLITGEVATQATKDKVSEIAKQIYYVRKVHNRTGIMAPSSLTSRSSDSLITVHIKTNILKNEIARKPEVKVVSEDGVVYLLGIVNREQKKQLLHITKSVGGVQNIVAMFEIVD